MSAGQKSTPAGMPKNAATCGVVMPISAIDGCPAEHWTEVKRVIFEAVGATNDPAFTTKLVSDAEDVGIIQKRIIQALHDSHLVICDVSGKNPNVMFELGMRLAFDRPVVIVKDDKTDFAFDTGIIEHLIYPRDLRYSRILEFKAALTAKAEATFKRFPPGTHESPFLAAFGKYEIAKLDSKTVSGDKAVVEMVSEMQDELRLLRRVISGKRESFVVRGPESQVVAQMEEEIGYAALENALLKAFFKLPEEVRQTLMRDPGALVVWLMDAAHEYRGQYSKRMIDEVANVVAKRLCS
jgi:hypothetical protein